MKAEYTVHTSADLAPYIWQRWVTPALWPEDDPDTKEAGFDAPVAQGVSGYVVPKRGPKSRMLISRFEPGKAFYLQTRLPLALMSFEHDMNSGEDGVSITHRLVFSGPLGGLFEKLIGKRIIAGFPAVMDSIVAHAQTMRKH